MINTMYIVGIHRPRPPPLDGTRDEENSNKSRSETENIFGGVNAHDKIYKWNGTDHRWMQKTPNSSLRPISVGSDGEVRGINREGCVNRWDKNSNSWDKKKGTLRQILVGSAAYIWGVNAEDNVYHWDTRQNAWTQMPGKLKHISVGSDGEVWGNERIKIIGPRPWVRMLSFSKQLRKWFDRVYYRVW
mmetsp:Transcript_9951/g.19109  ORF Transcript_9951/g.19109 Transcript_9951/m.19109 type:complete len:188 (-) Transcript_9951:15-578(-)